MSRIPRFAGVIGALLVSVFLIWRFTAGTAGPGAISTGALGAALLAVYLIFDREAIGESASAHSSMSKAAASGLIFVAGALAIVVNMVAAKNPIRWDLTWSEDHTLSPHSIETSRAVDSEVEIVGFFQEGSADEGRFIEMYEAFAAESAWLTLTIIDPLKSPIEFQQFRDQIALESIGTNQALMLAREVDGTDGLQSIVLNAPVTESEFAGGLTKLTLGRAKTICFTIGHGERSIDDTSTYAGYGGLLDKLLGQNYNVGEFTPYSEVDPSCEVVVIASPQTPFHPVAREVIAKHVQGGGGLIVTLEPVDPSGEDPLIEDLTRYGIRVGSDLIIEGDPERELADVDKSWVVLDSDSYDYHPIVNNLQASTVLQGARSVGLGDPVEGINVQVLAFTTEQGWAETSPDAMMGITPAEPDGEDIIGRAPLMAVAEVLEPSAISVGATTLDSPETELSISPEEALATDSVSPNFGRVMVFGDADFVSNRMILQGVNHDLFLNAVGWMVDDRVALSTRPNEEGSDILILTAKERRGLWALVMVVMPGLALLAGGITWRRRRNC